MNYKKLYDSIIEEDHEYFVNEIYNNIPYIENNIPYNFFECNKNIDVFIPLLYYSENELINQESFIESIMIEKLVNTICKKESSLSKKYLDKYNYYINVASNEYKLKLFILQIMFYHYNSLYRYDKEKYFVGIDFEFNEQKIALCQMSLFFKGKNKYIWIFDPRELSNIQVNYIIKFIYNSNNIYKLVHGSDSLDIPYLFNDFFNNDKNTIHKFVNRMIDTRFLCEYEKIANNCDNKKCSIYDAMLYVGTINDDEYRYLTNITTNMGLVHQITWDVHDMSVYHIEYALYDVFYLEPFLIDIFNFCPELDKQLLLVIDNIRFIFLEKWEVETLTKYLKPLVDSSNNYFIKRKNGDIKLIDIYNRMLDNPNNIINISKNLLKINYFKSSLTMIFKYIVYYFCKINYTVNETNKIIHQNNFDLDIVIHYFNRLNMNNMLKFILDFVHMSKPLIHHIV